MLFLFVIIIIVYLFFFSGVVQSQVGYGLGGDHWEMKNENESVDRSLRKERKTRHEEMINCGKFSI